MHFFIRITGGGDNDSPLVHLLFNQLFTGIVGCGLTSRGNGADFGILRMDFIKAVLLNLCGDGIGRLNNAVPATKLHI